MSHPYMDLPEKAFWRSAISERSPLELQDVYVPRFEIGPGARIAAAGSCFAQHIGRQFKQRGFAFLDLEPPPPMLPPDEQARFGFGLYSARYGNVYSVRQLVQMFERAEGSFQPQERVWQQGDRFFDPFRPSIEPDGFASEERLEADRQHHLSKVDRLLAQADVFVFTFGLTESWVSPEDGAVLPTCPGTVAGEFDAARHRFHNFGFPEVMEDAERFIRRALDRNPAMKILLTVSPVPLTATASGHHVLPATIYSKSVLRAVCGALYEKYPQVDYFPSYELVSSHPMRAMFFEPNLRSVAAAGVRHVMDVFFAAHGGSGPSARSADPVAARAASGADDDDDDAICDEVILEEFAR